MSILETIMAAQGGSTVRQLGSQFGLGEQQTTAALAALAPALAAGFQQNIQSPTGLGSLVAALTSGNHRQYIDNPSQLGSPSATTDGNGILKHVLGSKEVSRELATKAAAQSGVSADVLKRMLPLVATMMMGAMARGNSGAASNTAPPRRKGGNECQSRRCPKSAPRRRKVSRMRSSRASTARAGRCVTSAGRGSRNSTCAATTARSRNTR